MVETYPRDLVLEHELHHGLTGRRHGVLFIARSRTARLVKELIGVNPLDHPALEHDV